METIACRLLPVKHNTIKLKPYKLISRCFSGWNDLADDNDDQEGGQK